MTTFKASLEVPYVSDEEANKLWDAISGAVTEVVGRVPNGTWSSVPDYDGPGRSKEETDRATREHRR